MARGASATPTAVRSMCATPAATRRRRKRERVLLDDGREVGLIRWPGEGTPMVLIHGLFDTAEGYEDLCRVTNRPCISFDVPGFGCSDRPHQARIEAYGAELAGAIEKLDLERFVLVGHSLGGAIASQIAAAMPGRVRSLVLLAPAGYGRLPLAEFFDLPLFGDTAAVVASKVMRSGRLVDLTYRRMVSNGHPASEKLLARTADAKLRSAPGIRMAVKALAQIGKEEKAVIRQRGFYRGPVTALWGSDDVLVSPAHADNLRRILPQAEIEVWSGMGHHPQAERPRELAELIERACEGAEVALGA